jgi:hypothetical protein
MTSDAFATEVLAESSGARLHWFSDWPIDRGAERQSHAGLVTDRLESVRLDISHAIRETGRPTCNEKESRMI